MKCPECGTLESRVKKTLIHMEQMGGPVGFDFGELKMRHRKCLDCGALFQTFEIHESVFRKVAKLPTAQKKTVSVTEQAIARRALHTHIDHRRSIDE